MTPASRPVAISIAIAIAIAIALVFATTILIGRTSRSPFTRSPADIAVDEPCRFMGSVHKESRSRIEALRVCGAITREEWICMARVIKAVDDEFTEVCKDRSVRFREIAEEQERRYTGCLAEARPPVVRCGLLSTHQECLDEVCI
jgi:hypothetical protein